MDCIACRSDNPEAMAALSKKPATQFDQVAEYIHVERGIIPGPVCQRALDKINAQEWRRHGWYDYASGTTFSGNQHEPDMLFANDELHGLLFPAIGQALRNYMDKFAHREGSQFIPIVGQWCGIRFNRYGPGQSMRIHHDHIHSIFDGKLKGIPVLSLVGNLNEDYEGGELAFFASGMKFALKAGDICLFPSCFLYPHRVLPVSRGQRFSFALWAW